jgi:hypothetical protein
MRRILCTSRFARHGRSAVLWAAVLFLFGQLALNLAIERWRPSVRYPDYGFRLASLRKLIRAHPDRPLVLMLGTSRTEAGVRPDMLEELHTPDGREPIVFNFGIPGFRPLHGLLFLNRLLADGVRPDWLFVELIPAHLHIHRVSDGKTDLEAYDYHDLPLIRSNGVDRLDVYRRWLKSRLWPGYSERLGVMDQAAPSWVPLKERMTLLRWRGHDEFGWGRFAAIPTPELRAAGLAKAREEFEKHLRESRVNPFTESVLRQLVERCRAEGIPVAFYLMPEGPTFRGWYDPDMRADADRFLARLQRECGVPVIDARDWIGEDDFIDSHHLLPVGATEFTKRFGRDVLTPIFAGKKPDCWIPD